jgi:hypothetical protein
MRPIRSTISADKESASDSCASPLGKVGRSTRGGLLHLGRVEGREKKSEDLPKDRRAVGKRRNAKRNADCKSPQIEGR